MEMFAKLLLILKVCVPLCSPVTLHILESHKVVDLGVLVFLCLRGLCYLHNFGPFLIDIGFKACHLQRSAPLLYHMLQLSDH